MSSFFSLFTFFSTGYGVLLTMILTLSLLVIWDWRLMLGMIVVVQLAVSTLMIQFHQIDPTWMALQLLIQIFCALMLAISIIQMSTTSSLRRRNNLVMHLLLALLLVVTWWLLQIDLPLPMLNAAIRHLFLWLAVVALILLSIGNDPISLGSGLLIWCIPLHGLAVLFVPIPSLLALVGLMTLLIGLACSYLVLTDRNPALSPPKQALMRLRPRDPSSGGAGIQQPIPVTTGRTLRSAPSDARSVPASEAQIANKG